MAIHSPACESYLDELLTTPPDSVDHRIAEMVQGIPEPQARELLLLVIDEDHGTHAAEVAREIWRRAADYIDIEADHIEIEEAQL